MQLWFIKLGKAISALRREGLIRGGRRVMASFFALFRRIGKGDILIVTGGLGDSARYRAWHVAEELTLHGIPTQTAVQDNPFLQKQVKRFSVFVFHRVMVTPSIQKMIVQIKQQKKTIIFDTDDLVYDSEFFQHMDMFKNMNVFEKMQYAGGVSAEILADPYVSVCTVSTTVLAERLLQRGKKVFVVRNKLSEEDVAWGNELQSFVRNVKHETQSAGSNLSGDPRSMFQVSQCILGYFSGTKSHDKDFSVVVPVLVRILERYPQVRLLLAGPLAQGNVLEKFQDRVESLSYVPRKEHFENIARCDINIVPLETGNPFCEAKSELKFFEAGIMGIPTVASATVPYCEAISDGVDGFVAKNDEEWFQKLSHLIEDEKLRLEIGEKARQTVLERYTTKCGESKDYCEFLRSVIKK